VIDFTQPEVAFAIENVTKASQLATRVQTGMATQNLTKSDLSPVTVGDFGIQALVARALAEAFPESVLVGEETSGALRSDHGKEMLGIIVQFLGKFVGGVTAEQVCDWIDLGMGKAEGRFWTLDPIDGTKGYLRGGQYAIALALIEDGVVQLGALGCPNLGDDCKPDMGMGAVVVAQRGQGTWYSVAGEDFQQLHVSECSDVTEAGLMRSVESGHTNVGQIDRIAEKLGIVAEPVRMDSQAKYAVVAGGGGELLLRLLSEKQPNYKECIWDQAAGSIILEEAGGRITDLEGKPLDFSQGRKLKNNTGVLASNGLLHDACLEAIAATNL
jgi:3'(2'), 5'-bisphosphate nucleotidase